MNCRHCGSENTKKFGIRHNISGNKQMFICKACNKKFSKDDGFLKMRHSKKIITMCLDLYYKGLSFRKIQNHLKQFHNLDVSDVTILRWIRKYSKMIREYTDSLKLQRSERLHMDETLLYKNSGATWAWMAMDSKTRFIVGMVLSHSRFKRFSEELIGQCSERIVRHPKYAVTDGYHGYIFPLREMMPNTIHKRYAGLPGKRIGNAKIERLNGVLKSRTKITSGFKTLESAEAILNGWRIYHNFIKPHVALNDMTPAEKCGMGLNGGNKWLELIKNSIKST